jgi:hypothetical protein
VASRDGFRESEIFGSNGDIQIVVVGGRAVEVITMHYNDHHEPEIDARGMAFATWVFAMALVGLIMVLLNIAS